MVKVRHNIQNLMKMELKNFLGNILTPFNPNASAHRKGGLSTIIQKAFNKNRSFSPAFTLTEVLIAVAIVGIIAALIIPAVTTTFQEKALSNAFDRQIRTLNETMGALTVAENKTTFYDTIMYTKETPSSYEDNAGAFLKKYMKVAKYCGDNNTTDNCFADKYYTYDSENNAKIEYTPTYEGACAQLKNGSSICIVPQVGTNAATCTIDINGPKGPNVQGRDLRENIPLDIILPDGRSTTSSEVVYSLNHQSEDGGGEECTDDDISADCCLLKYKKGEITSNKDACCMTMANSDSPSFSDTYPLYAQKACGLSNTGGELTDNSTSNSSSWWVKGILSASKDNTNLNNSSTESNFTFRCGCQTSSGFSGQKVYVMCRGGQIMDLENTCNGADATSYSSNSYSNITLGSSDEYIYIYVTVDGTTYSESIRINKNTPTATLTCTGSSSSSLSCSSSTSGSGSAGSSDLLIY